jgi:hypothetical protein
MTEYNLVTVGYSSHLKNQRFGPWCGIPLAINEHFPSEFMGRPKCLKNPGLKMSGHSNDDKLGYHFISPEDPGTFRTFCRLKIA